MSDDEVEFGHVVVSDATIGEQTQSGPGGERVRLNRVVFYEKSVMVEAVLLPAAEHPVQRSIFTEDASLLLDGEPVAVGVKIGDASWERADGVREFTLISIGQHAPAKSIEVRVAGASVQAALS